MSSLSEQVGFHSIAVAGTLTWVKRAETRHAFLTLSKTVFSGCSLKCNRLMCGRSSGNIDRNSDMASQDMMSQTDLVHILHQVQADSFEDAGQN
eukprot:231697-Amphidinium_carterae.1